MNHDIQLLLPKVGTLVRFKDMGGNPCEGVIVEAVAKELIVYLIGKGQVYPFVLRPDGRYQWDAIADTATRGILAYRDVDASDEGSNKCQK